MTTAATPKPTWTEVARHAPFSLMRRDTDGKFTVVRTIGQYSEQVSNAMPGDAPEGGGQWMAPNNSAGISYVATGYSESYARRVFRQLAKGAE